MGVIRGTVGEEKRWYVREMNGRERDEMRKEEGRTEILDGRVHLGHSDDVGDSSLSSDDTRR